MRLTDDNYELMMFDLLEGNLTEDQELDIMAQIEEDEFYFREWKLMKATVLTPDESVVFEGKSALLKKDTKVVVLHRRWVTISVAASLFLGVILFWQPVPTPDVANNPVEQPNVEGTIPATNTTEETPVNEEVITIPAHIAEETTPVRKTAPVTPPVDVQDATYDVPAQFASADVPALGRRPMNNEIQATIPNITTDGMMVSSQFLVFDQESAIPQNISRVASFVTSRPQERIKNKAQEIYNNVRDPKLKLKPQMVDRKPGLEIEFESKGYHAIANIQPFKAN